MMYSARILAEILENDFSIKAGEVSAIKTYLAGATIRFDRKINSEQEALSDTIDNREDIKEFLNGKFVYRLYEHGLEMDYCPGAIEDHSKYECNQHSFIIYTKDWIIFTRTVHHDDQQPMVTEKKFTIVPRNY